MSRLLDPRTFPVARLAGLVHALPPPGVAVDVADAPGGTEAAAWLAAHGRPARLVPAPEAPQATRLWEPSPGLLALEDGSPWSEERAQGGTVGEGVRGNALDLGCGTGRDAVWLAMRGWRVTAVDRLPDALDRAKALAELHGVALDLRRIDMEREPLPEGGYGLVLAVRHLPDLARAAAALAPSGTLLVETFTDRERARTGKPRDPSLVLPANGPPPLPDGLTLQDYRVREHGGRDLASLTAKRL